MDPWVHMSLKLTQIERLKDSPGAEGLEETPGPASHNMDPSAGSPAVSVGRDGPQRLCGIRKRNEMAARGKLLPCVWLSR